MSEDEQPKSGSEAKRDRGDDDYESDAPSSPLTSDTEDGGTSQKAQEEEEEERRRPKKRRPGSGDTTSKKNKALTDYETRPALTRAQRRLVIEVADEKNEGETGQCNRRVGP